jgi:hypothetical protein
MEIKTINSKSTHLDVGEEDGLVLIVGAMDGVSVGGGGKDPHMMEQLQGQLVINSYISSAEYPMACIFWQSKRP